MIIQYIQTTASAASWTRWTLDVDALTLKENLIFDFRFAFYECTTGATHHGSSLYDIRRNVGLFFPAVSPWCQVVEYTSIN